MAGDYYKNSHPGGISAVVNYWSSHIDGLQYYPMYKVGGKLTKGWWFLTSYMRLAFRMAFDKDASIVHLHTAADGSFKRNSQLAALAKKFGRKVVMHIHASRFKDFYNESPDKAKILQTLQSVDRLIVLSESWKEWFKSIGIEESKITILHNITPEPTIMPEAKKLDGKVRFLFMGEIGQRKGVFDILRALAAHRDEAEGCIELIIGGNRNEQKLLDTIKENGLEDIVRFEGWVSGEKKLRLLNEADVYILPSFNEGLPISILEAMSYGNCCVVSDIPECTEVVENHAVSFPRGNGQALAETLQQLCDDPRQVEEYRDAACDFICGKYNWDHVTRKTLELYR